MSVTPEAESTAPVRDPRPCRFCQVPVPQPKRLDITKDFCSDRHRAAFRDQQFQDALRQARNSMQDMAVNLSQMAAELEGRLQLLARFERHPRKPKGTGQLRDSTTK